VNIVLTGKPGIGKTTVIEKVVGALGNRVGGFVTKEVREAGKRTGFLISALDGESRMLASRHQKGRPRVGPYKVLVPNLEAVGIQAVERALKNRKIVVVDEIGKMELISSAFRAIIIRAIESDLPVLATLSVARDTFSESIRRRSDLTLLEVTKDTRDTLPERILEIFDEAGQFT
jgi:nucleoside-triphosphatase